MLSPSRYYYGSSLLYLLVVGLAILAAWYPQQRVLTWFEFCTDGLAPDWLSSDSKQVVGALWALAFDAGYMAQSGVADALLEDMVKITGANNDEDGPPPLQLVEMAAGSGVAPWKWHQLLTKRGFSVHTVLTDLQPQIEDWEATFPKDSGISFVDQPVDAASMGNVLKEIQQQQNEDSTTTTTIRMIHFGLHHLEPAKVQSILRDAMASGDAILVADLDPNFTGVLFGSVPSLFQLTRTFPKMVLEEPEKLLLLPFTPLLLFLLWHDSLVSVLRSYSHSQLVEMMGQECQVLRRQSEQDQEERSYQVRSFKSVSYGEFLGLPNFLAMPISLILREPFLQFFWAFPIQGPPTRANHDGKTNECIIYDL